MLSNGSPRRKKALVYRPKVDAVDFMRQWVAMIDRLDPSWRQQIDSAGLNLALLDLVSSDELVALDSRKLEHLQEFLCDLHGNMLFVLQETAAKNPEFIHASNLVGWLFMQERGSSLLNEPLRRARCEAIGRLVVVMVDAFEHRLSQIRLAAEERENRDLRRPRNEFPELTEDVSAATPDEVVIGRDAARNVLAQVQDDWDAQIFGAVRAFLSDPASPTVRQIAVRHGVSASAVSRAMVELRQMARPYLESCSSRVIRVFAESLVAAFRAA
jgi:hypothetical protein